MKAKSKGPTKADVVLAYAALFAVAAVVIGGCSTIETEPTAHMMDEVFGLALIFMSVWALFVSNNLADSK